MFSYIDLGLTADETTLLQYLLSSQISVIRHLEFDTGSLRTEDFRLCQMCEVLLNRIKSLESDLVIEKNKEQETEEND